MVLKQEPAAAKQRCVCVVGGDGGWGGVQQNLPSAGISKHFM